MAIYFLGGGNMASAIIAGLRAQSSDDNIIVANRSADKNQILEQKFAVQTAFRLPENINANDVVILAVKPQDMRNALTDVQTHSALILSLAAGLEVATLSHWLNSNRIIRVMPNTPCAVGLGISGLFAATGASDADKVVAEKIMSACGVTIWVENENMMHAITAISGSGSAYAFYLMNALKQAATDFGFTDKQAHELALQTFRGAVMLAAQSGEDFAVLQQKVTSKGGTTFAALTKFDECGVASGVQQGAQAAAARSMELAQMLK